MKKQLYIYVCYLITKRNDNKETFTVDFSNCESFKTMAKAVNFCKKNYANYMIAVESADYEVWESAN